MKYLSILLVLFIFTNCKGSLKESSLIGNWEYENSSTIKSAVPELEITPFDLNIKENGNFQIISDKKEILGTWELKDSILELTGRLNHAEESDTEKMHIYKLTKNRLSVKMDMGTEQQIMMNMVRKDEL